MGIQFAINGELHYGWARFTNTGFAFLQLNGAAYETVPGKSILAGEVPEPGTLGLLALGLLGVAAWRRKKAVTGKKV